MLFRQESLGSRSKLLFVGGCNIFKAKVLRIVLHELLRFISIMPRSGHMYASYYVLDAIEDVCLTKPQLEVKKMICDLAAFVDNVTIDTNATDDTQVILVFF